MMVQIRGITMWASAFLLTNSANTDPEPVKSDVTGLGQLYPVTRLQLRFDDRFARWHVLARHAVRNADCHWTLQQLRNWHKL